MCDQSKVILQYFEQFKETKINVDLKGTKKIVFLYSKLEIDELI